MIKTRLSAALVFGLLAAPAFGHGPTPQQLERSVTASAAPEAVWEVLSDPASIGVWHPLVSAVSVEGEGRGAKRHVTLEGGEIIIDGLDDVNAERKQIRWRLSEENHAAIPISYYTNTIEVTPEGEGSKIDWRASFFRADTTNEPEEHLSDAAAVAAMESYVDKGLEGLKTLVEGGQPKDDGSH